MTLATRLAAFAAALRWQDLQAEVIADAKLRVLDTLGVMLAGSLTATGRAMLHGALSLGQGTEAAIIGFPQRSTASLAALVNGTLAHAMDFDDTHNASVMHPSAVSVAAALAVTEATGGTGRDLLLGVALGNEIGCRLGLAAPGAFHAVGQHPTSVLGTPAAALVAARQLGLGATQMVWALGIAASQGSGVLEAYSDGTWSKTLHPGWAAHAGIVAAHLARAGFTGPETGLDGRYGLFPTHIQAQDYNFAYDLAAADLGTTWHSIETAFKLYPNAHAIHVFAEMALSLHQAHTLTPDRIESVTLHIPAGFEGQIAVPRAAKLSPGTTTHARASVFYAVAAALTDGTLGMDHYVDAAITRPDILALAPRIHHVITHPDGPIRFSGGIEITCTDGRTIGMALDEADGTGTRRQPAARLEAKFRATAGTLLPPDQVERLIALCRDLDGQPDLAGLIASTTAG